MPRFAACGGAEARARGRRRILKRRGSAKEARAIKKAAEEADGKNSYKVKYDAVNEECDTYAEGGAGWAAAFP